MFVVRPDQPGSPRTWKGCFYLGMSHIKPPRKKLCPAQFEGVGSIISAIASGSDLFSHPELRAQDTLDNLHGDKDEETDTQDYSNISD